jgi:hypothetical protein
VQDEDVVGGAAGWAECVLPESADPHILLCPLAAELAALLPLRILKANELFEHLVSPMALCCFFRCGMAIRVIVSQAIRMLRPLILPALRVSEVRPEDVDQLLKGQSIDAGVAIADRECTYVIRAGIVPAAILALERLIEGHSILK